MIQETKRLIQRPREDRMASGHIRPMNPENTVRYGEIYAAAFSGEPWNDPWDPADAVIHVRELLESKQSYGMEYVEDGKVVGFILGTSMLFHYGRTFVLSHFLLHFCRMAAAMQMISAA